MDLLPFQELDGDRVCTGTNIRSLSLKNDKTSCFFVNKTSGCMDDTTQFVK